jgi:glucose/arabinose dehydrogenase
MPGRGLLALSPLVALAACGGGGGNHAPDAAPAPYCTPRAGSSLRLQLVTDQVARPVAVAAPAGDPRLFVVEQPGRIRVVKEGALLATPFLTIDVNDLGNEQGLLGLAFHPRYADNGRFFVHYVRAGSNDIRIAEYHADPVADVADPAEKVILEVPHPARDNHNGGTVVFGRDGYLYISTGDGGGANDERGNGQNRDTLAAKVLRIDVDDGDPYAIPASNPWRDGARETFAWGLRNPWKIAFDPATGDLWIGDVGQGAYEEVDVVRAGTSGQNFGWPVFEGPECFTADADGDAGCDRPGDYVLPVLGYDRRGTERCSVVVAPVYRGACMPDLTGRLFFGDYCSGEIFSFPATATALGLAEATDHTADADPDGVLFGQLAAFGVDGYGELHVTALARGRVYRLELE